MGTGPLPAQHPEAGLGAPRGDPRRGSSGPAPASRPSLWPPCLETSVGLEGTYTRRSAGKLTARLPLHLPTAGPPAQPAAAPPPTRVSRVLTGSSATEPVFS